MNRATGTRALKEFLRTDPRDVGCGEAIEILHVYAGLMRSDAEDARARYPGVAAHLRSCGPCAEDLDGLLAALGQESA